MTVDIRMTRARSILVMDHPFFGALAMRMNLIASAAIETMATEGKNIFYNRAFLDTMSALEILFVVAHEVLHCALGHHVRREGRDHEMWNKACDYVINLMLVEAGFIAPSWALLDRKYAGLNAEEVYRILDAAKPKQAPQQPEETPSPDQPDAAQPDQGEAPDQDGEPQDDESGGTDGEDDGADGDQQGDAGDDGDDDQDGEGSGDGLGDDLGDGSPDGEGAGNGEGGDPVPDSHGDPGRCGEILDAAPPHDKAALAEAAEEWEVATRQAVNIARRIGEGKLPGFLEQVVEHLNDAHTDWRDVLRRFVEPSNTKDYSWTRPNRRLMSQGYYVPGLISDGVNHVALIVDTSGSVDEEALGRFGAEVQGALDDGAVDKVTVIMADTHVRHSAEYESGSVIDFTVVGRGGTNFAPSFAWINENAPDVACAIYFTDLKCNDFGPEPYYPVLWAPTGSVEQLKFWIPRVPFGECVDVNQ